jgi:hypothetical protein
MDSAKDRAVRAAAAERAREYRAQAAAYRRLTGLEPLPQKRRLLALSALRYEELAASEEMIAVGRRRETRFWPEHDAANGREAGP